jgi:hypothetical protein
MARPIRWTLGLALVAFATLAGVRCGDECSSPFDCDFGEACVSGACINNSLAVGQSCSINADCADPSLEGATAICVGGQCQISLNVPAPDAGPGGNGGGGTGSFDPNGIYFRGGVFTAEGFESALCDPFELGSPTGGVGSTRTGQVHCPLKGDATYWTILGVEDAAWSYESPFEAVAPIAGHLAFYDSKGFTVEAL